MDMRRPHHARAAGQHDRFMVAADDAGGVIALLEGAKLTGQGRAAKLVVV